MPELDATTATVWDDLETLVFDRDDVHAALGTALAVLGDDDGAEVPVEASVLAREHDEWLASIPRAAFVVLVESARPRPAHAPRLAFAIAQPL